MKKNSLGLMDENSIGRRKVITTDDLILMKADKYMKETSKIEPETEH